MAELTKLDRRNVALGGFSQGGHMALQAVYGHVSFFIANFCLVIIVFNMQGLKVGACFALSSFLCSSSSVLDNLTNSNIPLFLSTGKAVIMQNK